MTGALKNPRAFYWSCVGGLTGLIYSTLYIMRPICEFLRSATPFTFLVNLICLIVLAVVVMGIVV